MTRCPHCRKVLDQAWLRREAFRAMGRVGGKSKARSSELASKAAHARWDKQRNAAAAVKKKK